MGQAGCDSVKQPVAPRPPPPTTIETSTRHVKNAVKYAPPGTTITVSTGLQEGIVRLSVADEGPGVPEEWRERVFEPYARRAGHDARGCRVACVNLPHDRNGDPLRPS